jgi:hypothetical protein
MKADNDNGRLGINAFASLPLFATDKEIATAIVGQKRSAEWLRDRFPTISAKSGFPPVDPFHGGRATPLVVAFYERYIGIANGRPGLAPDGVDREITWKRSRHRG